MVLRIRADKIKWVGTRILRDLSIWKRNFPLARDMGSCKKQIIM